MLLEFLNEALVEGFVGELSGDLQGVIGEGDAVFEAGEVFGHEEEFESTCGECIGIAEGGGPFFEFVLGGVPLSLGLD